MGKVASSLGYNVTKPLREFNLEQRVARELSREKRATAPRHSTTSALIDEAIREQPQEVKNNLKKRDDLLLDRLRSVYVTSEDVTPTQKAVQDDPERPLPTERRVQAEPEYGFVEPKVVPYGKVTLRNAVQAVTRHQENPILWSPRRLAIEYRLSVELTEKVLRHFQTFVMVVPPDTKKVEAGTVRQMPLTASAPHTILQLTGDEGVVQGKDKDKNKS